MPIDEILELVLYVSVWPTQNLKNNIAIADRCGQEQEKGSRGRVMSRQTGALSSS
jgi:hypothetical protein